MINYVHDPLGRRIAKKVDGIITEKYLWQGLTRLLAVYDGADNLKMRFEYADARMPVAMTKNSATYYLAYDQVGSLKVVADAAGNVVKKIEYDTFGNVISDSDPAFAVPFGFAGGLHDKDTGLVRFGYRDYDPETGRWTAKDPIGFAGGDTDLYGYCLDDPVNFADPLGLVDYDVDSQGFHVRLDTKSNITFVVDIDDDGNYTIKEKPGHPLSKSQKIQAENRFRELINDPVQQRKMRDAVAKKYPCFADKIKIGRTGRNLRRLIGRARAAGWPGRMLAIILLLSSDDIIEELGEALDPLGIIGGTEAQ